MKGLLYKAVELKKGYTPIVNPSNSVLKYLEFGVLLLPKEGERFEGRTIDREYALTIFTGRCTVNAESPSGKASFKNVGGRADVFSGKPTAVYLPPNTMYEIISETSMLEIGVSAAPSESSIPPVLVRPEEVVEKSVGSWNWSRKVYTTIGDNVKAEKLLVGETINPPGNWSSAPPHKHDKRMADEVSLEEVYFYKIKPDQGFALQRIYSDPEDNEPFDEAYVVENNDTIVIPRGYHPVVAAPGYYLYYLWMLAGEERKYGAWKDDPRHSWLRKYEPILREFFP